MKSSKKNVAYVLSSKDKMLLKTLLSQSKERVENLMNDFEGKGFDIKGLYDIQDEIDKLVFVLKHDVTINIPDSEVKKFELPIEVKKLTEWVTVMVGDFSFVDNDINSRECYVNNIVTIEKYTREEVDEFINRCENDGHGWVILEDYDGLIHMNNKIEEEKREEMLIEVVIDAIAEYYHNTMKQDAENGDYSLQYALITGEGMKPLNLLTVEELENEFNELFGYRIKIIN